MKRAIYALKDPATGIIGYVGQTVDTWARLEQHVKDGQTELDMMKFYGQEKFTAPVTSDKSLWIAYLLSQGRTPELEVLELSEDFLECEGKWIAIMLRRGEPLTNNVSGQFLERHGLEGYDSYQDCPYDVPIDAEARRAPDVYTFDLVQLSDAPVQRVLGELQGE